MRNRIKKVSALSAFCVVVVALSVLTGCKPADTGKLLVAQVDLVPTGSAMKALVWCIPAGSFFPVSGATVTVNGESVPEFFGNLSLSLTAVSPGQNVTLQFSFEDIDILKTLAMPAKPNITTAAATHAATDSILIEWDAVSPTLDNIAVSVSSSYTNSSNGYTAVLAANAINHTIPGSTFLPGQGSIPVIVEAMNKTTDLGSSAMAGSIYQVGNQSSVVIATN
jgi:hypothetical protein